MAIHKLTSGWVAKVTKDGLYGDGGNLWLQVRSDGAAKSWMFRWSEPGTGRGRVISLGPVITVDIHEARDLALKNRKLLLAGKDPQIERDGVRLDDKIRAGIAIKTVKDVCNEFYDAKISRLSVSARRDYNYFLGHYVLPRIGNVPIAKLTKSAFLDGMPVMSRQGRPTAPQPASPENQGKVGFAELWGGDDYRRHKTARTILSYMKRVLDFAIHKDPPYRAGPNPLAWDSLKHDLPEGNRVHKTEHHPSLPWEDIPAFMQELRSYIDQSTNQRDRQSHPTSAFWLEFIVLTGVRLSEARLATWDEFKDLDGSRPTWCVPPDHHKIGHITDKPHIVPVTKRMLGILHAVRERHGTDTGNLVFPSPFGGGPYRRTTANQFVKQNMKWGITPHGFRQTLTNWGNAHGMPAGLIDFQVGHIPRGAVAQAYHTDPQVEIRRPWMEKWDAYCSLPPAGDNIVTLPLANKQGAA
jgi:integrase